MSSSPVLVESPTVIVGVDTHKYVHVAVAINAVMEAFFSTVENEVGEWYETHGDAKGQLFVYIEVFYNQRRRHSSAGRMSPAAFERKMTHAA